MERADNVVAASRFPAEPSSARSARGFVRRVLGPWLSDELVEVAELLTSELVANAVVHGRSRVDVVLSVPQGALRVAVTDVSRQWPVVRDHERVDGPSDMDETGRGLALVGAMAEEWGVVPTAEGKTVWFRLGLNRP